jgi:hypothetical protein
VAAPLRIRFRPEERHEAIAGDTRTTARGEDRKQSDPSFLCRPTGDGLAVGEDRGGT